MAPVVKRLAYLYLARRLPPPPPPSRKTRCNSTDSQKNKFLLLLVVCVLFVFFIIFIHVSLSLSQQNRFIIIIGGGWVVVKKKTIDRSRLANICNDKLLECGITQANTNAHLLFSLGLSLFTNRAPRASLKYRNRQGKKSVSKDRFIIIYDETCKHAKIVN